MRPGFASTVTSIRECKPVSHSQKNIINCKKTKYYTKKLFLAGKSPVFIYDNPYLDWQGYIPIIKFNKDNKMNNKKLKKTCYLKNKIPAFLLLVIGMIMGTMPICSSAFASLIHVVHLEGKRADPSAVTVGAEPPPKPSYVTYVMPNRPEYSIHPSNTLVFTGSCDKDYTIGQIDLEDSSHMLTASYISMDSVQIGGKAIEIHNWATGTRHAKVIEYRCYPVNFSFSQYNN